VPAARRTTSDDDDHLDGAVRSRARPRASERRPRRELVCTSCLYGVVVVEPPARCPMCGGSEWAAPSPPA